MAKRPLGPVSPGPIGAQPLCSSWCVGGEGRNAVGSVLWHPWPQAPVKGPEFRLFVNSFIHSFIHCSLSLWKVQGR